MLGADTGRQPLSHHQGSEGPVLRQTLQAPVPSPDLHWPLNALDWTRGKRPPTQEHRFPTTVRPWETQAKPKPKPKSSL